MNFTVPGLTTVIEVGPLEDTVLIALLVTAFYLVTRRAGIRNLRDLFKLVCRG